MKIIIAILGVVCISFMIILELTMQLTYSFSIFSAVVVGFFSSFIGIDVSRLIERKIFNIRQPKIPQENQDSFDSDYNINV